MWLYSLIKASLQDLPGDPIIRQLKCKLPIIRPQQSEQSMLILVQAVKDPYYIVLFSALLKHMEQLSSFNAELFVFTSLDAEFGVGIRASLKRSFPYLWLTQRQWLRMYEGVAPKVGYRSVSWAYPLQDAIARIKSNLVWKKLSGLAELEALNLNGIHCGDLIIDTYLRFRPAKAVDLKDPFLRDLIWQAFRDVARAKHYFKRAKPKLYLSSYATYIQHGIAVRVALAYGTRVVTFGNLQQIGKVLTVKDVFHTKNPTGYKLDFEERTDQDQLIELARSQLEARLSGGIDVSTSYMTTSAYAGASGECPDVRGAVIVYLHDFFDSPHIYADLVFSDFWIWICCTIETLQAAKIPFYLKRHPNQVELSAGVVSELKKKYSSVLFVPDGVTTRQLVTGGMACAVTVYGTIAHEVAYLGVPSIACARHPHIAFNFCHTARSIEEYKVLLQQANQLALGDIEALRKQVLEFYAMHNIDLLSDRPKAISQLAALWRACNSPKQNMQEIVFAMEAVAEEPAFGEFVRAVLLDEKTIKSVE
jgi:hypothetical protein